MGARNHMNYSSWALVILASVTIGAFTSWAGVLIYRVMRKTEQQQTKVGAQIERYSQILDRWDQLTDRADAIVANLEQKLRRD